VNAYRLMLIITYQTNYLIVQELMLCDWCVE